MNITDSPFFVTPQTTDQSKQLYSELKGQCEYYPYSLTVPADHCEKSTCYDSDSILIGNIPLKLTSYQVFAILEQCGVKPEYITNLKQPKVRVVRSCYCFAALNPHLIESVKNLSGCILPDIHGYWVNTTKNPAVTKQMCSLTSNKLLRGQQNAHGLSSYPITIELNTSCKSPSVRSHRTKKVANHFFAQKRQLPLPPPLYELHNQSFQPPTPFSKAFDNNPLLIIQNGTLNPFLQGSVSTINGVTVYVGRPMPTFSNLFFQQQALNSPQAENSTVSPPPQAKDSTAPLRKKSSLAEAFGR